MSEIKLENLKKSFGKTDVIHDLSIDVKDGELIVIVGPSGCGKSTLLRMVDGVEDANQGNIIIDGKKVNELEPMERNIAMVFQNYALYPHMSVFDNMAYGHARSLRSLLMERFTTSTREKISFSAWSMSTRLMDSAQRWNPS